MSDFVFATGPCVTCGALFRFNPRTVPSSDAVTGKRQPICEPCVSLINVERVAKGLAPVEIPPGAYEIMPAAEL